MSAARIPDTKLSPHVEVSEFYAYVRIAVLRDDEGSVLLDYREARALALALLDVADEVEKRWEA